MFCLFSLSPEILTTSAEFIPLLLFYQTVQRPLVLKVVQSWLRHIKFPDFSSTWSPSSSTIFSFFIFFLSFTRSEKWVCKTENLRKGLFLGSIYRLNMHRTRQTKTSRALMETFLLMLSGNRTAHAGMNSSFANTLYTYIHKLNLNTVTNKWIATLSCQHNLRVI